MRDCNQCSIAASPQDNTHQARSGVTVTTPVRALRASDTMRKDSRTASVRWTQGYPVMQEREQLKNKLRRIANETAELPGIRLLAEPVYRRMFQRPYRNGNAYYGAYPTYDEALKQIADSTNSTYNVAQSAGKYREFLDRVRLSDYPLLYWLARLFPKQPSRLFDLGGHIGVSYYGFRRYLDYPARMRWLVHDVAAVCEEGKTWARDNDSTGQLEFVHSPEDVEGCDILLTSGALQYLDYTLADLLAKVRHPPADVLVNQVPMHSQLDYFTLQNIGFATCPYHVQSVERFTAGMEACGYACRDHWQSHERQLRVPFRPHCAIDSYHGFYFSRSPGNGEPPGNKKGQ